MLARCVRAEDFNAAEQFFEEEYALDLYIHQFPKVLVVIADGITMGGGLGLTAGADVVIATERTRMAMPETGIGFFPDVGASKWLFSKCPEGYAEFLALSGARVERSRNCPLWFGVPLALVRPSQGVGGGIEGSAPVLSQRKGRWPQRHSFSPLRAV